MMEAAEKLVDRFFTDIFRPADRRLVEFIFRQEPTQENVDSLLEDWDIEVAGGGKALALSYVAKRNPGLEFGAYTGPRLLGMWNRARFDNLRLMANFGRIVKALNKAGIIPMVVKGGAIKMLNPGRPRIMGDVDIVVRVAEYEEACRIVQGLGYVEKGLRALHSSDFVDARTGDGVVDVHQWLDIDCPYDHERFMSGLFDRAQRRKTQGGEVLLPSAEDHFFLLMMNLAKNISHKQTVQGILNSFFDSEVLMANEPSFDWSRVFADVRGTGSEPVYCTSIAFVKRLAPAILPDAALGDERMVRNFRRYAEQTYFWRHWKLPTWKIFRRISIKRVLFGRQSARLWFSIVPYYCLLKLVDGHPMAVSAFLRFSDGKAAGHAD